MTKPRFWPESPHWRGRSSPYTNWSSLSFYNVVSPSGIHKMTLSDAKLGMTKEVTANKVLPFLIPLSIENGLTVGQVSISLATEQRVFNCLTLYRVPLKRFIDFIYPFQNIGWDEHLQLKVAGVKVYPRRNRNNRAHAVSACDVMGYARSKCMHNVSG